ncbi:MAG: DUF4926 domain-containing protein [Planctomycetes bacterium]|nr:DUF4926 domain-containing protein [Planctomycetota bacterium]
MQFQRLDTVILNRDLPQHGLRRGDLGAVVEVYLPNDLEVEFVTLAGRTAALLTLPVSDVRGVSEADLPSVRSFDRKTA